MNVNWAALAMRVPGIVQGAVAIQAAFRGKKTNKEKKDAVIDQLDEAVELMEFAAGRDLFKNPVLLELRDAYIDAEAATLKAKNALRDGILNHAPQP